jgi:uncharacterized phage protein (TIGR02218 family)
VKTLASGLTTHLASGVTTLAVCWKVTRTDGVVIRGTEHDTDIVLSADSPAVWGGTYQAKAAITGSSVRSTADLSVDNMEVEGAENDLAVPDLTAADIEAGLFDDAEVVVFLVNWASPNDGRIILRTGNLGVITRTAEGQYRAELRGLAQRLMQRTVRTYGVSCDAELGDARCGVDVDALAITGTVTAVTSNRVFTATLVLNSPQEAAGYFSGGLLTWSTGDNAGFSMELKADRSGSPEVMELFLPMPYDIAAGDTFALKPGCDKSAYHCKVKFDSFVNFRGHGVYVPGMGELAVFGGQTGERTARHDIFSREETDSEIP